MILRASRVLNAYSELYALKLRDAITDRMLCEPRFVLAGYDVGSVESEELQAFRSKLALDVTACSSKDLASMHALLTAVLVPPEPAAEGTVPRQRKVLAFCSKVEDAELLAQRLQAAAGALNAAPFEAYSLSGKDTVTKRKTILQKLKGDISTATIICSARVLQEGVDEPCCDTVALMYRCANPRMLVQMIGRALRLQPGKDRADVIIPVQTDDVGPVVAVIAALAGVDSLVAELVRDLRSAVLNDADAARQARIDASTKTLFRCDRPELLTKVLDGVREHLTEDLSVSFGLASYLKSQPADRKLRNVPRGTPHGDRLFDLRAALARMTAGAPLSLKDEALREELCEDFPGIDWNEQAVRLSKAEQVWTEKYEYVKEYKQMHGSHIPYARSKESEELRVHYTWGNTQRTQHANGVLSSERIALLDEIGFSWVQKVRIAFNADTWKKNCAAYSALVTQNWMKPPRYVDGIQVPVSRDAAPDKNATRPPPEEWNALIDWARYQQRKYTAGAFSAEKPETKYGAWCFRMLNSIPGWTWKTPPSVKEKPTRNRVVTSDEPCTTDGKLFTDALDEAADSQAEAAQAEAQMAARRAAMSKETALPEAEAERALAEEAEIAREAERKAQEAKAAEAMQRQRNALAAVLDAAKKAAPDLPAPPLRGGGHGSTGERRLTDSGEEWRAWDGSGSLTGNDACDAARAAELKAAATERDGICDLRRALKAALDLRRDGAPACFYLMPHTKFTHESRWVQQLDDGDKNLLFPSQPQAAAAGAPTTAMPYKVVTFGVMLSDTRIRAEFDYGVPAAFGYPFCEQEAKVLTSATPSGDTVDGRDAERELKALLKKAKKWHAPGKRARNALLQRGVVPFDHPACAFADMAPDGIKDETMLLSEETWLELNRFTTTAELSGWLAELTKSVELKVGDPPEGPPHTQGPAAAAAGSVELPAMVAAMDLNADAADTRAP
jgi:hypothetical protein